MAVVVEVDRVVEDLVVYEVVEKWIGGRLGIEGRARLAMGDQAAGAVRIERDRIDEETEAADGRIGRESGISLDDIEEQIRSGTGDGRIEAVAPGVGAIGSAIVEIDYESGLGIA